MPTWVRHQTGSTTTGGFWTGTTTPTYTDNCNVNDKASIENAFNSLNGNAGLNCCPPLRDAMRSSWPTIPVDCCFDDTRPPRGGEVQAFIFVCKMTDHQIQVELCKGLVQVNGGDTLDTKAMIFACFGAADGAPSSADFNQMVADPVFNGNANERVSQFFIWNRNTGEVWEKTTTSSGGFWTGSTTTAKGTRCFIDAAWVF
jgi:hypothetical protein